MTLLYQHYISEYNSKVERFLIKVAKKYGQDSSLLLTELYALCGISKNATVPKKKITRPKSKEVVRLKKTPHGFHVHEESLLVIDKHTHRVKGKLTSFDSDELMPVDKEAIYSAKFHRLPLGKLPENLK